MVWPRNDCYLISNLLQMQVKHKDYHRAKANLVAGSVWSCKFKDQIWCVCSFGYFLTD